MQYWVLTSSSMLCSVCSLHIEVKSLEPGLQGKVNLSLRLRLAFPEPVWSECLWLLELLDLAVMTGHLHQWNRPKGLSKFEKLIFAHETSAICKYRHKYSDSVDWGASHTMRRADLIKIPAWLDHKVKVWRTHWPPGAEGTCVSILLRKGKW